MFAIRNFCSLYYWFVFLLFYSVCRFTNCVGFLQTMPLLFDTERLTLLESVLATDSTIATGTLFPVVLRLLCCCAYSHRLFVVFVVKRFENRERRPLLRLLRLNSAIRDEGRHDRV